MNTKVKTKKKEQGITLIALIVTIIVLIILAAVAINTIYQNNMITYAINGAGNYASEAVRENEIMNSTASLLDSAIGKVSEITGGSTSEEEIGPYTGTELASKIGDYVDYTPTSSSFTSSSTYSGFTSQTYTTDTSLKWRILFANEDTLTLIADTTDNTGFWLKRLPGI